MEKPERASENPKSDPATASLPGVDVSSGAPLDQEMAGSQSAAAITPLKQEVVGAAPRAETPDDINLETAGEPPAEPDGDAQTATASTRAGASEGAPSGNDPSHTGGQDSGGQEGQSRVDAVRPAPANSTPDDPGIFDDLVVDFGGEPPSAPIQLPTTPSQRDHFSGFDSSGGAQPAPPFHLGLPASDIWRIVQLQEVCSTRGRKPGAVRISVSAKRASAQIHEDAFCELVLQPCFLHLVPDVQVVIYLRGDELKAAANAVDGVVELRHVPALPIIHFSSENFERPLVLESASAFRSLSENVLGAVEPDFRQAIPDVLVSGIRHVSPHVTRDDIRPHLNGIDCQNGAVVGGRSDVIAKYKSPLLDGLDLCIPFEHAGLVNEALSGAGESLLLRTQHFYVVQAGELTVGVPRFPYRSKIFSLELESANDSCILASRPMLKAALTRVRHAIGDNALVRLTSKALGNSKLVIRASDPAGASLRDPIDAYAHCETFDVTVRSADLKIAIDKHEGAANVLLRLSRGHLVIDDSAETSEAITIIADARTSSKKGSQDDDDIKLENSQA